MRCSTVTRPAAHWPGSFPNPSIAADSVGGPQVAADSLTQVDLAPNSAGASELGDGAVDLPSLRSGGSGSTIYNPPSIAGDSCYDVPLVVALADPGELFIPSTNTELPSGIYLMPTVVSTDGVAWLRTCNGTSDPIEPPVFTVATTFVSD